MELKPSCRMSVWFLWSLLCCAAYISGPSNPVHKRKKKIIVIAESAGSSRECWPHNSNTKPPKFKRLSSRFLYGVGWMEFSIPAYMDINSKNETTGFIWDTIWSRKEGGRVDGSRGKEEEGGWLRFERYKGWLVVPLWGERFRLWYHLGCLR